MDTETTAEHSAESDVLTDEVRDLLRDWWDEDTTVGVESAFPIIHRVIRERMAQAWDEGHRFTGYEPSRGENPYRTSPAQKPNGAALYLDILESTNPSPKVQAVIDQMRRDMSNPPASEVEKTQHDKDGQLDRSICGLCGDAYWECSKCGVYFCECSRSESCHLERTA